MKIATEIVDSLDRENELLRKRVTIQKEIIETLKLSGTFKDGIINNCDAIINTLILLIEAKDKQLYELTGKRPESGYLEALKFRRSMINKIKNSKEE